MKEQELLHEDLDIIVRGGELRDTPFRPLEDHADAVAAKGVEFPIARFAQIGLLAGEVEEAGNGFAGGANMGFDK